MTRELYSLFITFWGTLLTISLVTFSQADPSLNHIVSSPKTIHNAAGLFGAYLSGLLVDMFGLASYLLALGFLASGIRCFFAKICIEWWRWTGLILLGICFSSLSSAVPMSLGEIHGGGLLGDILFGVGWYYLRPVGSTLLWTFFTLCAIQLVMGGTWEGMFAWLHKHLGNIKAPVLKKKITTKTKPKAKKAIEVSKEKKARRSLFSKKKEELTPALPALDLPEEDYKPEIWDEIASMDSASPDQFSSVIIDDPIRATGDEASLIGDGNPFEDDLDFAQGKRVSKPRRKVSLPVLDLFTANDDDIEKTPREVLETKGRLVMECLEDFNVQGELQRITPGPVVTMFEVKPAPGVKVSKIANLSNDIAMALSAVSVRIQAPIPGKDTVGIEIPNEIRELVSLKELFASDTFISSKDPLTLAIGKDISGIPFTSDLAKMPHLLVAGATGQGKSVFINSVLMSLLFKTTPESLQLLLIDPKRIELAVYADLPHLVHPVVTDMSQAKNALDWAVHEMDKRYEAMSRMGVRNVISYNTKLKQMGDDRPENLADLQPIPYLVIIIDELADLMLTAAKEVETSIVRLAQLARAAGIHLILATQRPSVDVVTGLIKANFPCRISFQVTGKHDSRTILDTVGAEHLLGKGDMLFKPGGGRLTRMHGAFVSDEDVSAVVSHWKKQLPPSYKVDFVEWATEGNGNLSGSFTGGGNGNSGTADDPLYGECVAFVIENGKASISLIQRRFRIGFNKAARFVEQMEQDGIVGPADGSKPRAVLAKKEQPTG
ncbi:cell division protein FtsK [Halodesulfovibrio spirochaetisodalis]|uniref:Cell division protein FtsK n=1 Tax=Halodesulfovibrio spirochaetisodalis TaxID=1560234 RepID=A0A1B7X8Y4_9BACT|nr:DNA translocase FtsK [Halodesulfovibrio spirochaetisodalis]OBQ45834.1 cell division protein FtsK [Halodesulfovibrio spirochaetisodalis]